MSSYLVLGAAKRVMRRGPHDQSNIKVRGLLDWEGEGKN